jgi:hypothetical protein
VDSEEGVVTALKDGGFFIAWSEFDDDSHDFIRQQGQRYDANGGKIGDQFVVSSLQGSDRVLALLDDGRFIAGFESRDGDVDTFASIFDPRDDLIFGTVDDDVLTSRVAGAKVKGKKGSDILLGLDPDDRLFGNRGKDSLVGTAGTTSTRAGKAGIFSGSPQNSTRRPTSSTSWTSTPARTTSSSSPEFSTPSARRWAKASSRTAATPMTRTTSSCSRR